MSVTVQMLIKNEVKLMREIHHESIIKLYEVYQTPTHVILIMEYARGGNLRQHLMRRHHRYEELEAMKLARNLLCGLDYLHGMQILHRDIKLENVFLMESGDDVKGKLGDFDLSIKFEDITTAKHTGTPGYVAPELFQSEYGNSSPAADIFSLGLMLYTMYSSFYPHEFDE